MKKRKTSIGSAVRILVICVPLLLTVSCEMQCRRGEAVPTPACGNGVPEAGEECDDGNADCGDGCCNCMVE